VLLDDSVHRNGHNGQPDLVNFIVLLRSVRDVSSQVELEES
jgi:hypothetical protein